MNGIMEQEKIRNVIRDTRRRIKYVIWSSKKLNRDEMMKVIRFHNYNALNLRPGKDAIVEINADELNL
jgi:hypothetical protein